MAGMTWKEFKEAVEKAGVKDDDEIEYFDFSYPDAGDFENDRLNVYIHEDRSIAIH